MISPSSAHMLMVDKSAAGLKMSWQEAMSWQETESLYKYTSLETKQIYYCSGQNTQAQELSVLRTAAARLDKGKLHIQTHWTLTADLRYTRRYVFGADVENSWPEARWELKPPTPTVGQITHFSKFSRIKGQFHPLSARRPVT